MPYSNQYRAFYRDKNAFFVESNMTVEKASDIARARPYQFLAENRSLIEAEYNHLKTLLQKNGENRQAYWLHCYYCCVLLRHYYAKHDQKEKAKSYRLQSEEIKKMIEESESRLSNDVNDSTTNTAKKISGQSNMQRLAFTFSRLTVKNAILMANDLLWLEQLDQLLGIRSDINDISAAIDSPGSVFNFLSVGLFGFRLAVNFGMVLKHTFDPTKAEEELTTCERLWKELGDRHYQLLNDLAWGTVNLFCNYNELMNISSATASWLTVAFLVFDLSLLLIEHHLKEQAYLTKKAQYKKEIEHYQHLSDDDSLTIEQLREYIQHIEVLNEQLMQLEASWINDSASLHCDIAAAILLGAGFTASLLFASPAVVIASYFACTIAVAMYISDGAWGNFQKQCFMLQQAEIAEKGIGDAQKNKNEALIDFIKSMVKNTVVPMVIMTALAFYWPAAVVLAVGYFVHEAGWLQGKSSPSQSELVKAETKQLSSSDDSEDEDEDKSCHLVPCG